MSVNLLIKHKNAIMLELNIPSASIRLNSIGGVMVSMLASSAVDRGYEPRSGQTKDYEICICCFSAKHAALGVKKQKLIGSESR
jgi:hypothetical protein